MLATFLYTKNVKKRSKCEVFPLESTYKKCLREE